VGIFLWTRRLAGAAKEHDRMVRALEESARQFRQLFESSPAPMYIHRGGTLLDANPAAARLLDADHPALLTGQEALSFVHPRFRDQAADRIQQVQATHTEVPPVEKILLTQRGREVSAVVQTVPLDLADGPAALVFAQDLTERRRAEEERHKLEVEIQHAQKLESLGSLAGGIAHDMNNVLAAIMGMATLLQLKREGDPPLQKALGTIENAATRGRDLVKGLTDFARKGLQQPVTMDLNALVRKELDLLVRTSRQRFTFRVDLEDELPPVLGEPSTLGSAIMNLCVNAFDAMPNGGSLGLRTWLEAGWVCLEVADTGEGIPPEILHRVTEPFFTTKAVGRGTGLGLAMVYGTMKAHGGTLDIQSEVGQGTRIRLRLPAATRSGAARDANESSEAAPQRRPLKVLLVDDDELIRSTLPPMLEQLGHRVETASSGLEAIRRLDAGLEVDLVILDHNMPGMTGAEALPRILQLRPAAQILVATGFMDAELRRLLAGFTTVLTLQKPFTMAELQKLLREIEPPEA
jgi:PAS domain S-box-containing protein